MNSAIPGEAGGLGGVDWAFEAVGSAAVLESADAATGRGGAAVAGRLPVERLKSGELPPSAINEALETLADGSALRQVLRPDWTHPP
jgi:alcohol dehydrogenase